MKGDFEDRKYWKTQKCNNLIKSVDFLAKSTSDVLCNFVFIFHWDDGVISMNFYPIWPVIYAWLNSTGGIEFAPHQIGCKSIEITLPVKGIRPASISMDLHPNRPASISMNLHPNLTGWIDCKSIEIMTTKFDQACNVISMNLQPNWPASISMNLHPNLTGRIGSKSIEITLPVKGHARSNLTDRSNLTSQIGSKSIEIMTTKFNQACNVISMNLHPNWPASISMNLHLNLTSIYLNEFTPKFDWSNWE